MNHKLGFFSSIAAGICTALFFLSLIWENGWLSYFICLFLSWFYVILACTFAVYAKEERKAAAYTGAAFAVIYSVFTNLVYFSQLTTVHYQTADDPFLSSITFTPGSWIFGFDLFGYGLMALSTFFVGLSVEGISKVDKWMKILFLIHGLFFPACLLMPMLNLFKPGNDGGAGVIALLFWCVYFLPVMVLSAMHFKTLAHKS
jgi:hypothetical protein